jgi:succinoglycan biosynthesis transport protein ExoP
VAAAVLWEGQNRRSDGCERAKPHAPPFGVQWRMVGADESANQGGEASAAQSLTDPRGPRTVTSRHSAYSEQHAGGLDAALEAWRRRKWLALAVFAAVLGAAVSAVRALPDLYRASSVVIIEHQQVSEAFVRPTVTAELETRLRTIQQEVMSRARLTEIIKRFDLYPEMRGKAAVDAVVERMRRDISLELNGVEQQMSGRLATIAFTVSYAGRQPGTVAAVANEIAGLYVNENMKQREGQASGTAAFLRAQLDDVKKQLDEQERRANEYKLSHIGELPQQVQTNLASLERLNTQLRLNGENQIRAMDRRERLEKQLADSAAPRAVLPPVSSPDDDRRLKLRQQLEDLRTRFTDEYPDVVRARTELAALAPKAQPAADTSSAAAGSATAGEGAARVNQAIADVDAELLSLRNEERAMRQAIAAYEARVDNAPKRQQEVQELSRDSDTLKERYDSLLKRSEEAQLAESLEQGRKTEQFRILDPAVPPRLPAAPNRERLLILGLVLAVGLAGAAVYAMEKINTSFHSIDDLRAFVTIPTLIRVPRIRSATEVRRQRRVAALSAVFALIGLALIVAASHYVAQGNEQIVRLVERGRI